MYVIGTAGHVDHGKSTLVEALTGINPDRLKEERERQMTIDLGFAWLTLPNGEPVGVVDVPGHQDFIENMLAGVGGIDAALFVVAADEGVMPQTREHLAILDLLQIKTGVVVLTKSDLVDAEWLGLVTADVRAALRGTALEGAPIQAVSARLGHGLDDLIQTLQSALTAKTPRADHGRPRLPIDRVFSLPGFGTVVTGTLLDGAFATGEDVELAPTALPARIRGLQTHKTKVDRGEPGSRVAINLAGVEVNQVRRGMVVARPGALTPTTLLDVRLRHLRDDAFDLKHNAEVKFFSGTSEVLGTVRLLEEDVLAPGESGWVQLVLAEPVAVVKGDRFIIRRPSPGETIGGGVVADPLPGKRHRRHDAALLARLETQARGTPAQIMLEAMHGLGPAPLREVMARAGLDREVAARAADELAHSGDMVQLDGQALVASLADWRQFGAVSTQALNEYHAAHPLRAGMPREELKSRLALGLDLQRRGRWTARMFQALLASLAEAGLVVVLGSLVRAPDHQVRFTAEQQRQVDSLLADFERDPYNTPSLKICAARVGDDLLAALIDQRRFVPVSAEVLFRAEDYAGMLQVIRAKLGAQGKITVAEVRDLFSTSRKYALALMEHLDAQGVTRRVGDERVLRA